MSELLLTQPEAAHTHTHTHRRQRGHIMAGGGSGRGMVTPISLDVLPLVLSPPGPRCRPEMQIDVGRNPPEDVRKVKQQRPA